MTDGISLMLLMKTCAMADKSLLPYALQSFWSGAENSRSQFAPLSVINILHEALYRVAICVRLDVFFYPGKTMRNVAV